VIFLQEEQKLVKIQYNKKTGQCHISIPRAFWDSVTGTGYLMASLQDGKLIYTPAPAHKQIKRGAKIPKFLQGNDSVAPVTSFQPVTGKKELTSKLDPSINPEEEQDVWEDDGEVIEGADWDPDFEKV
jgi:hypothetical protein